MVSIVQGGKAIIPIRLITMQNGVAGDPFDLTGITQISTCIKKLDGTELALSLTGGGIVLVGSPLLGKMNILLSAAESVLLDPANPGILELALTFSGDPIKIRIPNAYQIFASDC